MICCACHANHTSRAAETQRRQGIHPTPGRAACLPRKSHQQSGGDPATPGRPPSAAPATGITRAERRRPSDARAYIRPLESAKCCACHANHTGWWLAVGWWLVGGCWLVVGCWWLLVGDWLLVCGWCVVAGGLFLLGGCWLVAINPTSSEPSILHLLETGDIISSSKFCKREIGLV